METKDSSLASEGQFMFVNKDATNVASRSSTEAYSINSHVQRSRKATARLRTKKPILIPKLDQIAPAVAGSKVRSNDLVREQIHLGYYPRPPKLPVRANAYIPKSNGRHRWRFCSSRTSDRRSLSESQSAESSDGSPREAQSSKEIKPRPLLPYESTASLALNQVSVVPSPSTILKKGNSDPFNAAPLPVSPRANEVLQYARRVGGFMIWPAESILKTQSPIIRAWWDEIHTCLEDVASLQSFLTYASTLQAIVFESARPVLISQALMHKAESLSYLRYRMTSQPVDLRTFGMAIHLFGAEFYSLDFLAAMTHLKALQQITDALGGLMSLPQVHREILLTSDVVLASICLSQPLFDVDEWDPGFVDDAMSRVAIRDPAICQLGAAIRSHTQQRATLDDSIRDPKLRSLFRAIRELFDVEDYKALKSSGGIFDERVFRWVHLRKLACQSRCLTYYIDVAAPINVFDTSDPSERRNSTTDQRCVEACLCVAAIYAESIVFGHPNLPSAHRRMSGLLQKSLITCLNKLGDENLLGDEYGAAMLWALTMGAIEEEKYKSKENPRSWHSEMFALVVGRLGLSGYEEVKDVLQGFAYSERVQDAPLKELMGKLEYLLLDASFLDPFS